MLLLVTDGVSAAAILTTDARGGKAWISTEAARAGPVAAGGAALPGEGRPLPRQCATVPANPLFGQVEIHRRPFARFAGNSDRAPVQFDQSLGERKAEADAVVFPVQVAFDLPERCQRDRYLFGRHPDARIRHPKGHAASRVRPDFQADP